MKLSLIGKFLKLKKALQPHLCERSETIQQTQSGLLRRFAPRKDDAILMRLPCVLHRMDTLFHTICHFLHLPNNNVIKHVVILITDKD